MFVFVVLTHSNLYFDTGSEERRLQKAKTWTMVRMLEMVMKQSNQTEIALIDEKYGVKISSSLIGPFTK